MSNQPPTTAPVPQCMRALERANEIRLARAELKRRVVIGKVQVSAVILDCPPEAQTMEIADLLTSQLKWGQTRCRKFLGRIPMSEKKTIGSLTDRQRRLLAEAPRSRKRSRAQAAASRWQRGCATVRRDARASRQRRERRVQDEM